MRARLRMSKKSCNFAPAFEAGSKKSPSKSLVTSRPRDLETSKTTKNNK